jgi:uncharacterized protein YlzI (FlbEa/FlbD family)
VKLLNITTAFQPGQGSHELWLVPSSIEEISGGSVASTIRMVSGESYDVAESIESLRKRIEKAL